jgi:hypothetical protein
MGIASFYPPGVTSRYGVGVITLIDSTGQHEMAGVVEGERLVADPAAFARATGWQLKPEGLCRDDVCVPVRDPAALLDEHGAGLDIVAVAAALGREAVADPLHGVVAIGDAAATVAESMATLIAPDFALPDIDGKPVSLADYDRRKRLLLAWSSW